jgi:YVTN family beta-propeller protein
VHGLGFSPDHRTIAVVAIGSNAVNFIDTATNTVKHVTYVGRSPHEAFFTPDGKEIWQKSWRRLDGHNQLLKLIEGVKFADGAEVVAQPAPPQAKAA